MAASMQKVCIGSSSILEKALCAARMPLSFVEDIPASSLFRTVLNCESTHLVSAARNRTFVTSSCHVSRSPIMFRGMGRPCASFACLKMNTLSRLNSVYFHLLPFAHRTLSRRMIFLSRALNFRYTQHIWTVKSESKKTAADDTSETPSCRLGEAVSKGTMDTAGGKSKVKRLKENINTIPNLLTTLRMASAPLLGYMVVSEQYGWALSIFALAGISDMLDGYIARNFPNQRSALGSAIDPLADKLLVTILTISLTSVGLIPLPLTALIVFRDAFLIAGGFYIRYRSLPPPITLSRYFDISDATVSLSPTFISKVNTGMQLSLVALSLAAPVFGFVGHTGLYVLWWATGATTFLSGLDYLISWRKYVTLLQKDQTEL